MIGAFRRRMSDAMSDPAPPAPADDYPALLDELRRTRSKLSNVRREREAAVARAAEAERRADTLEALVASPTRGMPLAPSDTWQRRALRAEAAHRALLARMPTVGAS